MDELSSRYDVDEFDYDPACDFGHDVLEHDGGDQGTTSRVQPVPATSTWGAMTSLSASPRVATVVSLPTSWQLGDRVSVRRLLELLPPAPKRKRPARAGGPRADRPATSFGDRPGDRLARVVPVGELLALLGWTIAGETSGGGSRWIRPDHSEPYDGSHDAEVYPVTDDEPEKLTVFSERQKAAWSITEPQSWSSWDLLGSVYCAGDWSLAARVAGHVLEDERPVERLADLVTTYGTPEQLAEALSVSAVTSSVREAIEAFNGMTIPVGKSLFVEIGGPRHGLWTPGRKQDDGKSNDEQIVDWVAWRPVRRVVVQAGTNSCPIELEQRFTVQLIRHDGTLFDTGATDLSIADSVSPTCVDVFDAGIGQPVENADAKRVANMLRILGASEREQQQMWVATGWAVLEDSRIAYLAPNGSMTSSGIAPTLTVGPPHHSEGMNALSASQQLIGWRDTVDDPVSTAEAVNAFLRIVPERPEIGITLLGALFASPLRLNRRTTCMIVAEPDSGKSNLAGALQAFQSAHRNPKQAFSFAIPKASVAGANVQLEWHRDSMLVADDFRLVDGIDARRENADMTAVVTTLVQSAYGSGREAKSTKNKGSRGASETSATVIITAEVAAVQRAIVQRCVLIPLRKGDVNLVSDGRPLYDAFVEDYALTGVARSFFGSYLRWLASEIEAHEGGLEWLGKQADRDANDFYARFRANRAGETLSFIATGWRWMFAFAAEQGFLDKLPSKAEVKAAIDKMLVLNTTAHAEADPGRRVLDKVAEMLMANAGHLMSASRGRPDLGGGFSPGWTETISHGAGETVRWDPKGPLLGYLFTDNSKVVIVNDAIRHVQRAAGMESLDVSQIKEALAKHVCPGTTPGGIAPRTSGITNRPRGFVFELDQLGLFAEQAASSHGPQHEEDEDF